MLGNVFSPWYAAARAEGPADPLQHCTFNVVLYGPRARAWALTERDRSQVDRGRDGLAIGPSSLVWEGDTLVASFDEVTSPFPAPALPSRLRGTVRLRPEQLPGRLFRLDRREAHVWQPIAPRATAEVELHAPQPLRFRGTAYFDHNRGQDALERSLSRWSWSRSTEGPETLVTYDCQSLDGAVARVGVGFGADGTVRQLDSLSSVELGRSVWGLKRGTLADSGSRATLVRALEDTPFYARSLIQAALEGRRRTLMHEELCLQRFSSNWVQALLPFRMRRAA